MKKIGMIVLLSLVFYSCEKNENISAKNVIESKQLRVNVEIQNKKSVAKNLTYLSRGIAKLSENENFKDLLYSEIEKRFDGDDNVLVETLNKKLQMKGISLIENIKVMNNENNIANTKHIYESFRNIDKQEYFPQVFIPNYSNLKKLGKIGKQKPYIYIFNGDEDDNKAENYKGYQISNGKIAEKTGINEKFANENEVWVISINERVIGDNNGNVVKNLFSKAKLASATSNEWKINNITVKVNLEGWAAGSAEVRLCAYVNFFLNTYNQVVFNDLFVYQGGGPFDLGDGFSVGVEKLVDKRIVESWKTTNYFKDNQYPLNESNNQSTKIHYVIFEHDSWPVANRSHTFGNDVEIFYRSSDPFYTQGTWLANNGNYWSNFSGVQISNNSDRIDCILKVIP